MIKVIKEGTKKRITCHNCGCYFSYEADDLKNKTGADIDEGIVKPETTYVTCPQCNYEIKIRGIK